MQRYICVHGHFYQPPRENPWLEFIEQQDSAYPYHDWNERITAECYAPNAASRILDGEQRILHVVNNYAQISFNFGPTLLAWLERASPATYRAILAADRESGARFSGHGSALAQAYNHMILPLANTRDKRTQVAWGVRDFEARFGRHPEGMWLPEAAVDLETLDLLTEFGIRFTVLSPYQAASARQANGEWRDVSNARVDPSTAYWVALPSGRRIAVFFYDGPISRGIAFEDLLTRGEDLAHRLAGAFHDGRPWPQLVHIATDGETYGHHRKLGDMGLAYCLHHIEETRLARITNYGEFLELHPPAMEARIFENSSWSCIHGVERWRANCGCNLETKAGWTQEWRRPLREALDWLRDELAVWYERKAPAVLKDPWAARDDYVTVILDRSRNSMARFFERHGAGTLNKAEQSTALQLLEIQRHAMLMYTSCGWFFDDLSGIETVQVIQYAGRAIQLAERLFGKGIEEEFLKRLERAHSNVPEKGNGRTIYDRFVRPAMVDLWKVGAHYAISSLFEDYGDNTEIYGHLVCREDAAVLQGGKTKLSLGRVRVESRITGQHATFSYGVLHLGDQNIYGGMREFQGHHAYERLHDEFDDILHRGDIPELIRSVDKHFGHDTFSLRLLFRDEQRRVVNRILGSADREAAGKMRELHREHSTLARFVGDLDIPLPPRLVAAIGFTLNEDLMDELSKPDADLIRIQEILDEAMHSEVEIDGVTAEFRFRKTLEAVAEQLAAEPEHPETLAQLDSLTDICHALPFAMNLWQVQNRFWRVVDTTYTRMSARADAGDEDAMEWRQRVLALAEKLRVRLPESPARRAG